MECSVVVVVTAVLEGAEVQGVVPIPDDDRLDYLVLHCITCSCLFLTNNLSRDSFNYS